MMARHAASVPMAVRTLAVVALMVGVAACSTNRALDESSGAASSIPLDAIFESLSDAGFPADFPIPPNAQLAASRGMALTGFDILLETQLEASELRAFYSSELADIERWALVELVNAAPLPILNEPWMSHVTDDVHMEMAHVGGPFTGMVNIENSNVHLLLWPTVNTAADDLLALVPQDGSLPLPATAPVAVYSDIGRETGRVVMDFDVDEIVY